MYKISMNKKIFKNRIELETKNELLIKQKWKQN